MLDLDFVNLKRLGLSIGDLTSHNIDLLHLCICHPKNQINQDFNKANNPKINLLFVLDTQPHQHQILRFLFDKSSMYNKIFEENIVA